MTKSERATTDVDSAPTKWIKKTDENEGQIRKANYFSIIKQSRKQERIDNRQKAALIKNKNNPSRKRERGIKDWVHQIQRTNEKITKRRGWLTRRGRGHENDKKLQTLKKREKKQKDTLHKLQGEHATQEAKVGAESKEGHLYQKLTFQTREKGDIS